MTQTAIVLFCLAFSEALFAGATIEGVVKIAPSSSAPPPAASARYQVKAAAPVGPPAPAQAVVYLEGSFKPVSSTNAMPQKHFQFSRSILPIQVGTWVTFPNEDNDFHNVFSYSKPKRFDLGRYRKDENPPAQLFDKPGVVKLYCEIHEHMRATILVLDTPYFTTTDASGNYKLADLPTGSYKLKVWLDENKVLEKPVELKDGDKLKIDFTK